MSKPVEMVVVGYQPSWRKWPDTDDLDYSDVMAGRTEAHYVVDGKPTTVRVRQYPVHRAYAVAGHLALPTVHPYINNTAPPPDSVLNAMAADLASIGKECAICYWEHAYQCYPPVAVGLKHFFRHSILLHADDCPGSTEIKTQPVAWCFDTVFHGNVIWREDGDRTASLYRRFGVADTHYVSSSSSGGLVRGLRDLGWIRPDGSFDIDGRVAQIRAGRYEHDLVFVGGRMGYQREVLNNYVDVLSGVGLRVRLHGVGMKHGPIEPYPPTGIHPLGLAWPLADLYMRSLSTVNCPFIGLMGSRPFDAWASGTALVSADPVGEMAAVGIRPGVHYAPYDGTLYGLASTVQRLKSNPDETEVLIRTGIEFGLKFCVENSASRAMERVLAANAHKWG